MNLKCEQIIKFLFLYYSPMLQALEQYDRRGSGESSDPNVKSSGEDRETVLEDLDKSKEDISDDLETVLDGLDKSEEAINDDENRTDRAIIIHTTSVSIQDLEEVSSQPPSVIDDTTDSVVGQDLRVDVIAPNVDQAINTTTNRTGQSTRAKIKEDAMVLMRKLAAHRQRLAEMQASARKFLPRVHAFFDDYSFIEDDMSWPVPKHLAEVELEEERSRAYRSAILKIALVYALPSALLLTAIIVMAVLLHLKCRRTDPQPQPQPELGESGEVQEMIPLAHDQDGGSDLHAEIMDEIEALDNALRDALSDDSD